MKHPFPRRAVLAALSIPLVLITAQTGIDHGRARAQDAGVLERLQEGWRDCVFPQTPVLGPVADVMALIEGLDGEVGYRPVHEDDEAYFLQHFNAGVEPPTSFEADRIFVVTRGASVWMHFVKNGCVYYYVQMSATQWQRFLIGVFKLKPSGKPSGADYTPSFEA